MKMLANPWTYKGMTLAYEALQDLPLDISVVTLTTLPNYSVQVVQAPCFAS